MGRCSAHTLSLPAGHRTEVSEVDRSPGRTIHPLHAVLLAGTVPLFLGTVLSDCACSKSDEVQWLNFSSWLIIGGLAFCGLTFCGLALLWAVVNERDEIGLNLVPDYLTSVREGGFYDWPYSYWGQNVDVRAQPQDPQQVAAAISPDYSLGSHVAALGVAFSTPAMSEKFANGVFVGEHGSWNRRNPVGYKVVFVPFADGRPAGDPIDFVAGFRGEDGKTRGRPVGVTVDPRGALIVADDLANIVWRVTPVIAVPAAAAATDVPSN